MTAVTPFVWLNQGASDAADFYTSVFADSERISEMPGSADEPMGVTVRVKDTKFILFNGGPDPDGRERAMQAMLGLAKFDIAALQAAYDGTARVLRPDLKAVCNA